MSEIIVYTKEMCPYCVWAKELLTRRQLSFTEVRVDLEPAQLEKMVNLSGRRTVPQIVIDGQPIGGFDDLAALERAGKLDHLTT